MTREEFNEKYKDHIEEGFEGLAFEVPVVTHLLDWIWEQRIRINPDFEFAQVKSKFGNARIYSNWDDLQGDPLPTTDWEIEAVITKIFHLQYKLKAV